MTSSERAKILAATMLGTLDTAALLPLIAFYAISLGSDPLMTGLVVGMYSAAHAPANLLFGRLIDRIGRRRPLAFGLFWDAASLVLYVVASSPLFLIFVRVFHGIGGGMIGPSSMSLISDSSMAEKKGRAMALYGIAIAVSVILGNAMAGPLVSSAASGQLLPSDFHRIFYVLSALLVVGGVISLAIREPSSRPKAQPLRWQDFRAFMRRTDSGAGYVGVFSLYFILGAFVTLVPPHLRQVLGYGPLQVAITFTVFAFSSLLFHYPAGILADRFGPALPAFLGLMAIAIAMATIPLAGSTGSVLLAMVLFGLGHGFVFPASSAFVARGAASEHLGVSTGLFYSVLVLGVAVGAPTMAAVGSLQGLAFGIWASAWVAFLGIAFVGRSAIRPSLVRVDGRTNRSK